MADANEISVAATGATGALSQLDAHLHMKRRRKLDWQCVDFPQWKKKSFCFSLDCWLRQDFYFIKHHSIACSVYLMSPFAPVRSLMLPCFSIIKKKLTGPLWKWWLERNVSYGLCRRWACERTPIDQGNIPSHMPGYRLFLLVREATNRHSVNKGHRENFFLVNQGGQPKPAAFKTSVKLF